MQTTLSAFRIPRQRLFAFGLLVAIVAVVWFAFLKPTSPAALLSQAEQAWRDGRIADAEQSARECFEHPSVEDAAILLAARCALQQDAPERALDYLQRTRDARTPAALPAHLLRARLLRDPLRQLSAAENAYRAVLEIDASHRAANEELARLLATCGRRSEAIPCALRVLQAEDNDLLLLLARESGLIHDPDLLQECRRAAPDDPLPVFGLAQYAAAEGETEEAIRLLRQSLAIDPQFAPAVAALGQQLANTRRTQELSAWASTIPSAAEAFAETWRARGQLAEQSEQHEAAVRCYAESLLRSAESRQATFRLAQALSRIGDAEAAERLQVRLAALDELETAQNRALFSGQPAGTTELTKLIECYRNVGRLREAFAWARVAVEVDPHAPDVLELWSAMNREIAGLPLQLTSPAQNPARTFELSRYPLPEAIAPGSAAVPQLHAPRKNIRFRDDAAQVGLSFMYHNGPAGEPALRMYQFTGGGIGVIDVDRDGFPDVVLTQGGDGPQPSTTTSHDRLFRNSNGTGFRDVTVTAAIDASGYGQGTAIGDVDGDGFADIFIANIGANQLWRNNGDGTFTAFDTGIVPDVAWTTSCLLADLDGDALPDLYEVNYLAGDDVYERTCRHPDGSQAMCMPFDFVGATDRVLLNNGRGEFIDVTAIAFDVAPDGKGLGIIAWNAHGDGRLEVLVANDTTPNAFLTSRATDARFLLRDSGITTGIGLNSDGKAEGCMGIAVGDIDEDGQLDVHITNFLAESNTLYAADADGYFFDRTQELGLHEPTFNTLGFGTQFLDADRDGQLELFVTNGHLQDLQRFGRPFRMPPQLFRFEAGRAILIPAATIGPYFEQKWLGRSAARVDWNRDGLEDLIVGQLEAPYALLTNTTRDPGQGLVLRLVGSTSPRDGTGATVRLRTGDRWQVRQMTAGDGYQASNQKVISFGIGNTQQIDELVVEWPSGEEQRFTDLSPEPAMLIVEGRGMLPLP